MTRNIQIQKPNLCFNLPSTSNTRRPRQSENTRRPETSSPRSEFHDSLAGFSLVPTWLQRVGDQLNRTSEKSYPFPQNSGLSLALSPYTSKPNSPLNTPLCFDTQSLNSLFGTTSSSEDDDRLYWEEDMTWSDGDERNEDLEDVYKSFRY